MVIKKLSRGILWLAAVCVSGLVWAAPKTYQIDSAHTYPAFEADHQSGLSLWRGKVNSTSGTIVMDVEAETGSVDVTMDMTTIDFGHDGMNEVTKEKILNVAEFPNATYVGALTGFVDGTPTEVVGEMTLRGVTKPLVLSINKFLCKPHYKSGIEICGADASASFDRSDWGVDYGVANGNMPSVKLLISIEALLQE